MVIVEEKIALGATYTYRNGKKETVVLNATADEWSQIRQALLDVLDGAVGVTVPVNGNHVAFEKRHDVYPYADCVKMISSHERSSWKMWMTVGDAFELAYEIERNVGK